MKTAPERDLVRAVITYLNARGAFAFRMNSGMLRGAHKGKPWAVRMGVAGMPDVLAVWAQQVTTPCFPGLCPIPDTPGAHQHLAYLGRLIAVECKRHPNKPTRQQEATMAELRKRGALVVVAYDLKDVEEALST